MLLPINIRWFGQRHFMAIQCFIGLTINYIMRFCLSIAITEMAAPPLIKEDPNSCPFPAGYLNKNVTAETEFAWEEHEQGLVNSAFFWGYVVTQIPGGVAADKWGAKKVIILGSISTCILTILTPFAARFGQWQGLVSIRVFIGVSQGLFYSALHTVVGQWIPKEERATWCTIIFSGVHTGNALNMLLTGLFLNSFKGEWDLIFYIYGAIGMCWTLVFYWTTYSSPAEHPKLTEEEKEIFKLSIKDAKESKKRDKTPWGSILRSWPVWGAAVALIGHDFGLFALITDLPKFMKAVLHFNVKKNGILNALTYFFIWVVSILSGILVDFIDNRGYISVTLNRKIGTTIASVGPSLGFIASVYTGCDTTIAVICLILGQAFMGFYYPSLKVNPIDLSPRFAGTVSAFTVAIGTSSGIVVPYLIGILTPNNTLAEWRTVMWVSFTVMTVTNIFYLFTASGETQPWDSDENKIIKNCNVQDHVRYNSDIKDIKEISFQSM